MANGAGKFLGGILIGGTIGAAIALLYAPRSGKETRQLLRKSADDLPKIAEEFSSNVQMQADRFTETAQRTIEDAMQRLQEAIAVGQEASTKLRQELDFSGNPIPRNLRDANQEKET
jgi:gas vesicle protein